MLIRKPFYISSFLFLFLSGCVAMEVAREVQSGRAALRVGSPKAAIPHFEAAARLNPNYVTNFTPFKIGIWSYVGRAYYEAGNMQKALEGFRRGRDVHEDDYGRIYLGFLLAQNGKRVEGMKELQAGLEGLHEWLETIPGRSPDGHFWDPGRYLRRTIEQTQGLLAAEKVDWGQVRENIKWLGEKLDDEIDEIERQRRRDQEGESRDSGGGGGIP